MLADIVASLVDPAVTRSLLQAAVAVLVCLGLTWLCGFYGLRIGRELSTSLLRGFLQMALVGVLLGLLITSGGVVGSAILLAMVLAAGWTASRRLGHTDGAFAICLVSIAVGAGSVIAAMAAMNVLDGRLTTLVPVGSMIIANAMNSCAQAIERFKADVIAHVGEIEAALCLGAASATSVSPYVQSSVYASLLPRLDMLKSLGLVWIPGVMAGMLISGASPLYAGIFQFIMVAMMLAASGLAGLVAIALLRRRTFSQADQLLLRPLVSKPA